MSDINKLCDIAQALLACVIHVILNGVKDLSQVRKPALELVKDPSALPQDDGLQGGIYE